MLTANLTIRGEGLEALTSGLARHCQDHYASANGAFHVFSSEAFYLRTSSDLLSYIVIEMVSMEECRVRVVAGGGYQWWWGDLFSERRDRRLIVAYLEEFCERHGWTLRREGESGPPPEDRPMPAEAAALVERLGLKPHPSEGGCYVETWRAADTIAAEALPPRYRGPRSCGTAIYFLLTPDTFSEMHRLPTDEVFHFYLGDPVMQLHLLPDGTSEVVTLGPDVMEGQRPQVVVPHGVWQGARLVDGGRFALLGTTMAPGFDFADYERGVRAELVAGWPAQSGLIARLTRSRAARPG